MLIHRARDIHKCLKNIGSFTDKQAKVKDWDSEHLEWIAIQITPKEGPYRGGKYEFKIIFGKYYPKQPPQVDCITPIYHPNIDMTGEDYNVCLSLFDEWQSSFGLEDVIQGILFLLYNPNLDDPLSPWFDPSMSPKEFEENLHKTLRGHFIEDAINYQFPKMIDSDVKVSTEESCEKNEMPSENSTATDATKLENCEKDQEIKITNEESASGNTITSISKLVTEISPGELIRSEIVSVGTDVDNIQSYATDLSVAPIPDITSDEKIASIDEKIIDTIDCNTDDKNGDVIMDDDKITAEGETEPKAEIDHEEMVDYIEDTFLTGFGELMAIELSDCDNDDDDSYDTCTSDDDESFGSLCEEDDSEEDTDELDYTNSWRIVDGVPVHSARSIGSRSIYRRYSNVFSTWSRRVTEIMNTAVNIYLGIEGIETLIRSNDNRIVRPRVTPRAGSIPSLISSESSSSGGEDELVEKFLELPLYPSDDSECVYTSGMDSFDESLTCECETDSDRINSSESDEEEDDENFFVPSLFDENAENDKQLVVMSSAGENKHMNNSGNGEVFYNTVLREIRMRNAMIGLFGIFALFKLSKVIVAYVKR